MIVISPGVGLFDSGIRSLRALPRSRHRAGHGHLPHHGAWLIASIPNAPAAWRPLGYRADVRRIGVLASGSGTILRAMLDADLPIAVVLVDRECGAVEIATAGGVAVEIVERTSFGADFDRVAYTHDV